MTQEILDLLQQATHFRQAKKGANEGTFLDCDLFVLLRSLHPLFPPSPSSTYRFSKYFTEYHGKLTFSQ